MESTGQTIEFYVPAIPLAQPRQRVRVMHMGGKAIAQNYTPAKHPVNAYKAAVQLAYSWLPTALATGPLSGPLRVDCVFVMPRPKSKIWKTKPMPRERHCIKPDRDNLLKSTLDALNGIAWVDDSQICAGECEKWVAAGDESPHVRITIRSIED